MKKLLLFTLAFLSIAMPVAASPAADVQRTIHQFIDGLNKGDLKAALAACDSPVSIVDEFPPYQWQGPGACQVWATAFGADSKKEGVTDSIVTLAKPRHVDIAGDRAYVVFPANYAYKQHGKALVEKGATLTAALRKTAAGWRVTAWAWSKP
ncbi:MAG: hypothetical protein ABR584_10975 [Candidatus Baltobacteraceae bacterium]